MKLKTCLQISAVLPIALAILVSLGQFVGFWGQDADTMVAIVVGVLALSMAVGVLVVSRRLMHRVKSLQRGIDAVSNGQFGHQLPAYGKNEIDELSVAFNDMSRQLQKSHDASKNEAAKHQRSADALRKANIMLSDALVKLKRAQHKVIENERVGALGQMASGIAHDFNSALTPILGFTDLMLAYPKKLDDKDTLVEEITTINRSARKARKQIKRLSQFFRPARESDVKPVNLNNIVERAVEFTKPMWKEQAQAKGSTIDVNLRLNEIPLIQVNSAALEEALVGLIFNAVESMSRGGTITLSTHFDTQSATVEMRDTGDGMTEEVRRRCLEPFFSTKGNAAAGMGLTVASGAIRRHEGQLDIETKPGFGTTVTVRLPLGWRAPAQKRKPPESRSTPGKLKLLVVDDDLWARQVFDKALKSWGHVVDTVTNGVEALEKVRATKFDVVLADMAMPNMSGDELAIAVKREAPGTPFILLTGFGDVMKKEGEQPDGVDLILDKPVSLDELRAGLAELIN